MGRWGIELKSTGEFIGTIDLHGDLGAVEGGTARIGNEVKAGRSAGVFEGLGGGRPVLVRSDEHAMTTSVVITIRRGVRNLCDFGNSIDILIC